MNQENTENVINTLTPGEAVFATTGGRDPQLAFLVRERSAVTKYFGETSIRVRAALLPVEPVMVVTVLFRVGRHLNREYVTWWDYYQTGGVEAFGIMSRQDFLSFHFHGDNGRREKSFVIENSLNSFFSRASKDIVTLPPWNRDSFREAVVKLHSRFPSPRELWCSLQHFHFTGPQTRSIN